MNVHALHSYISYLYVIYHLINEKLMKELGDARGTIGVIKLEVNKLSNDLLLLHQSTLNNKRPLGAADAAINGHLMRTAGGVEEN